MESDETQDWVQATAKSFKSGCKAGSADGTVSCDYINVHMDRPYESSDSKDSWLQYYPEDKNFIVYGWIAYSADELTGDYVAANLYANTASPGASVAFLSGKTSREALTDEDTQTISDWEATLDPRNPVPTVLGESDDEEDEVEEDGEEDEDEDGEDEDEDGEDSDDEEDEDEDGEDSEDVPDAASYMTVAAATITAFGAILV